MTLMQEDKPTHQQLEQAVKLAVVKLMTFTGFDGFMLEMPAGANRPPHLVVVGTVAEIRWLLDQRAARQSDAEPAGGVGVSPRHRERH